MHHPHVPILYWFPGVSDPSQIPAPYAARFTAERSMGGPTSKGPDAARIGLLISPISRGACVYLPEIQRWRQIDTVGGQVVWLGVRKDVDPAELLRTHNFGGAPVDLGGRRWTVPVCNPFVRSCSLPWHEEKIDGKWSVVVDDEYQDLAADAAAMAGDLREQFLSGGRADFDIPDDEFRDLSARILGLNYDVTAPEIGLLRLFTGPDAYAAIVAAWLDIGAMTELLEIAVTQELARVRGSAAATLNPTGDTGVTSITASGAPVS